MGPFLKDIKVLLRDWFYLHIPIKRWVFHHISSILPTFIPIEGYLREYIPKNGDVVIDAGAFPGNFTIILSRLIGKNGKVIALEANRKYYKYLSNRFKRLALKNIILLNVALWNSDGERPFFNKENEGSSLFIPKENKGSCLSHSGYYVPTKKLDTIIEELGIQKVNYLKADIEGAEIEAIEGGSGFLCKQGPNLAIACYHLRDGHPTAEVLSKKIAQLNYKIKVDFLKHLTLYAKKTEGPG